MTPHHNALSKTFSRLEQHPLMTVFFLALGLRLFLLNGQGLWCDEVLTLNVSSLRWPDEMLANLETSESNKPPLYYLLMHYWQIWGTSEVWVRLPSVIFSVLGCVSSFWLGRYLAGPRVGFVLGLLLAFSPLDIWYAQETRMYALLLFASSAALWTFLKALDTKQPGWWFAYTVCAVTTLYSFTYGFFILAFTSLLACTRWPQLSIPRIVRIIGLNFAIFLSFAPWLWRVIVMALDPACVQADKGPPWLPMGYTFFSYGYGFSLGPTSNELRLLGKNVFLQTPLTAGVVGLALAVLAGLSFQGLQAARKLGRPVLLYCVLGIFIFLAAPAVICCIKPGFTYNPRYALMGLSPFLLSLALGLVRAYTSPDWKQKIIPTCFLFLMLTALVNYYFVPAYGRDDIRSTATYLNTLNPPPKKILVCAAFQAQNLRHYYRGPSPVLGYNASGQFYDEKVTASVWPELHELNDYFIVVYSRADHGDKLGRLPQQLRTEFDVVSEKEWSGVKLYQCRPRPKP